MSERQLLKVLGVTFPAWQPIWAPELRAAFSAAPLLGIALAVSGAAALARSADVATHDRRNGPPGGE